MSSGGLFVQWFPTKCSRQGSPASCCAALVFLLLSAANVYGQGFAGSMMSSKKKITLHRKLPAAIHLTATTFAVKATARDNAQADVAQSLSEILETDLLKNDSKLHAEAKSPEF